MTSHPTLLQLAEALDPFERLHVQAIFIQTAPKGYKVRFTMDLYRPDDPHHPAGDNPLGIVKRLPGLDCTSVVRAPDIERIATWRIPMWDQVCELVRDKTLSSPDALGTMYADERARVIDGLLQESEAHCDWHIATHGKQGSAERNDWRARIRHHAFAQEG